MYFFYLKLALEQITWHLSLDLKETDLHVKDNYKKLEKDLLKFFNQLEFSSLTVKLVAIFYNGMGWIHSTMQKRINFLFLYHGYAAGA